MSDCFPDVEIKDWTICGHCNMRVPVNGDHNCYMFSQLKSNFNIALIDIQNEYEKRIDKLEISLDSFSNTMLSGNKQFRNKEKELEERVIKLESHYYSDGDLSAIHGQIDNIHRIDKYREHDIERLEKIINEVLEKYNEISESETWRRFHTYKNSVE